MTIRVLVVDDSKFFVNRIKDALSSSSEIEVVGVAYNGIDAIKKVTELSPDVVTMDIEMPGMNGIEAVKEIMRAKPTPILMFSAITVDGARATFDALDAGAVDFLSKKAGSDQGAENNFSSVLRSKIMAASIRSRYLSAKKAEAGGRTKASTTQSIHKCADVGIVLIGTSTGGPVALQTVLKDIPSSFSKPILLIQHMPGTFTAAFANRLNDVCKIEVREAVDGDQLKPGLALLAPGGRQMKIEQRSGVYVVRINDDHVPTPYKPCVDYTFMSAARNYNGKVLAIVLTGMGHDGLDGARVLKKNGSYIWAQDEATSTIFGMPGAIVKDGIADRVLPIGEFSSSIINFIS